MMTEHLQAALNDVRHASAERRTEAAAAICDLAVDLGKLLPAVAGLLVVSALIETEKEPYEQMLFTLGELSVRNPIPSSVLAPLGDVEPSYEWDAEYIQDILENAFYGASED